MSRRAPVFERVSLGLLLALILWAPFPLGSNRAWAWGLLEAGLFVAGICWLFGWMRGEFRTPDVLGRAWPGLAMLGAWLVYLTIYWVPLPPALVGVLSPEAGKLYALAKDYGASQTYLSVDPNASFVFWLKSCAYATAFFLVIALCRDRGRLRLVAYTLVLSGLVQAVYGGLMHLAGENFVIFGASVMHASQASGGFVNRNHLAGFLEIALAVGIGLMIADLEDTGQRTWRRFARDLAQVLLSRKAPLRIFLIVMVVGLVMTRSRMGNTAFFSSLLVAGAIGLALSRHATRSTVVLIASLIVMDIFIVGAWFGVEKTVQRIEETTKRDVEERVDPSGQALAIYRDFPVFGSGAGTFYTAFSRYRSEEILPFFDFVHNDYVQFLTDTGAMGICIIGLFAIMALAAAILAQARRRDPLARGMGFAVVMGTTALGIHSAVDFNLQIPANAFAFMILLAFGWLSLYLDRGALQRRKLSKNGNQNAVTSAPAADP
jgi:putative inorganic carbon (HCO3(-)) transporter